jgi:hypothetical protein
MWWIINPMIDLTRNVRRNLEYDFRCAVKKAQRKAVIVPDENMVKEGLFEHTIEADVEGGEIKWLSKPYGICGLCRHRSLPGSQAQTPPGVKPEYSVWPMDSVQVSNLEAEINNSVVYVNPKSPIAQHWSR